MSDLLTAILYSEDLGFSRRDVLLEPPYSYCEEQFLALLKDMDNHIAWNLKDWANLFAREQYDEGFRTGIRFGAQLMRELLEEP